MTTDTRPDDLDERLRRDLPRLADLMTAEPLDAGGDDDRTDEVDRDRRGSAVWPRRGRSPRRLLVAAAIVLAVVVIGGAVLVRAGDRREQGQVDVGPAPAAAGWQPMAPSPLSPREGATAVWTGREMIVWGGRVGSLALSDGAAYDPETDTWRTITPNSWGHPGAHAVWTGDRMVVVAKSGGAAYDPSTDSWQDLPLADGASFLAPVWTGQELVGIGLAITADDRLQLGADLLPPGADAWSVGATTVVDGNAFASADAYDVVWTGTEAVVWNGVDQGWAYDPASDSWRTLPRLSGGSGHVVARSVPVPVGGTLYSVVSWTGRPVPSLTLDRLVADAWEHAGPDLGDVALGPDASVTPAGGLAVVLDAGAPPRAVDATTGAWTDLDGSLAAGGVNQSAVWTGDQLLVWGGTDPAGQVTAAGARWRPPS